MTRHRATVSVAVAVSAFLIASFLSQAIQQKPASAAATALSYSTAPPSSVASSTTFNVTVAANDSGFTGTVALTKSGTGTGTFSCTGGESKAAPCGSAAFTGCKINKAGSYTITASSSGLSSAAANVTVTPGTASKLVYSTAPSSTANGGSAFATQPTVQVRDSDDNVVTSSAASVTLAISGGASGAVLTCVANPKSATSGSVTFSGCKIDKSSATAYTLTASSGSLTTATASITVNVGPAAVLVFMPEAAGASGGTAFTTQPTVQLRDAGGNLTASTASVTLAISGGTSGATLTCTNNPKAATAGSVTFAGCKVSLAGTYTLTASGLTTNDTQTLQVGGTIEFTQTGHGTARSYDAGVAFSTQPQVTVKDGAATMTSSTAAINLGLLPSSNTEGATLTCTDNSINAVAGVATFAGCRIDKPGSFTLSATNGTNNSQATDAGITIAGGSAVASLDFTVQPGAATGNPTGGVAFPRQPTVTTKNASGAAVTGSAPTLSITSGTGTPGATLAGCTSSTSTTGVYVFSGCKIDKAGPGYTLTATVGSVTQASSAFDVGVGPISQIAFATQPGGSATGGVAFPDQPVVEVQDAGGNRVTTSAASIGLGITSGTGVSGAALSCAGNPITATAGRAVFSGCKIDKAGTGYTLTAADATDSLTRVSSAFAVTTGAASIVVFTRQPSGATPNVAFSVQPKVEVQDAGGNRVTGTATPTLLIKSGTGTSGAVLSGCSTPTSTTGEFTYTGCKISKAGTGYVLRAALTGPTDANSAPFSVATAAPASSGTPPSVPLGQTFGGREYAVNPTAVDNNVNSATGSLVLNTTDLEVAAIAVPFVLKRSYDSADTAGGSFGRGWTSIFDNTVQIATDGKTATVRGEDGQQLLFKSNTSGGWVAPAGARATLSCAGSSCTVTRFNGLVWHTAAGKIQDYLGPTGHGLRFAYTNGRVSAVTVQTSSGAPYVIAVTTNTAGQVTGVATPTRSTSYGYTDDLLTSFTDARGKTWTYTYDSTSQKLLTLTDPLSQRRRTITYASTGRVASATMTGDSSRYDATFAWAAQTATRSVLQDVNGSPVRVDYVDRYVSNRLVSQTLPNGGRVDFVYDSKLSLIQTKDPLGWVNQSAYSAAGDLITQSVPTSATTSAVSRRGYDSIHRPISLTDPNGNTTTFTYSGPNLMQVTPPGGAATRYTYDAFGQMTSEITPTGSTTFAYDRFGNITSRKQLSPGGAPLNGFGDLSGYDEAGNLVRSVDPRGVQSNGSTLAAYTTTLTYDPSSLLLTKTLPGPKTTTYAYDNAGILTSVAEPNGRTTTTSWSETTRTSSSTAAGATTQKVYDPNGQVVSTTDPTGAVTTTQYNALGLVANTTDPTGLKSTFGYDLAAQMVSGTDSTGNSQTMTYNPVGRLVSQTTNGRTSTTSYDPAGNVLSAQSPDGLVTSFTWDKQNRTASVTMAAGTTSYTYDGDDNLIRITDPNGHITNYAYDGARRQTAKIVNGATWTYGYDIAGNLVSKTDPDGRVATFDIDAFDRVTGEHHRLTGHPNIDVAYEYDDRGRLTEMTDATGTQTYTYGTGGNLASVTKGSNTFTYDYATAGKRIVTYPDSTQIALSRNDAGDLMSVATGTEGEPGYASASYIRNPKRQVATIAYSNGALTNQRWDVRGALVSQAMQVRGTPLVNTAYTHDASGNRSTMAITEAGTKTTLTYGYDSRGRLTGMGTATETATLPETPPATATPPTAPATDPTPTQAPTFPAPEPGPGAGPFPQPASGSPSFSYDGVGNRLSSTTAAGTTTFTYDARDRIASQSGPGGSTTWSHDNAGNVTGTSGPSGTTTFAYDAAGRLASAVVTPTAGSATTSTYTYDGSGLRATKTVGSATTKYLWDVSAETPLLALERDGSDNLVRRYIYGDGPVAVQTSTATYFFHLDALGSVTHLTDSTGAIVASYRYDGYGNVTTTPATGAPANPLLFQGQYLDSETGLYYMWHRYYDPGTGRFTQRDSTRLATRDPVVSPYVFVDDRPTMLVDPRGESGEPWAPYTYDRKALYTPDPAGPVDKPSYVSADDANKIFQTKLAVVGATGGLTSLKLIGTYSSGTLKQFSSFAAGPVAKGAGQLKNAGKALKVVKVAGLALAAAAFAFSVVTTAIDCDAMANGPPEDKRANTYKCAGGVVGLAFMVGCTVVGSVASGPAAGVICNLAGGVLSFVIAEFGPQIEDLVTAGVDWLKGDLKDWLDDSAGPALDHFFVDTLGGGIISGLTAAGEAIASGFIATCKFMASVGWALRDAALFMTEQFLYGMTATIDFFKDIGAGFVELGDLLEDVFTQGAAEAAAFFKSTFNATVTEIGEVLADAYDLGAAAGAAILDGLSYGVDEVGTALKDAWDRTATEAAQVLKDLGKTVNQIGSFLDNVYGEAAAGAASVLNSIGATVNEIAGALDDVFDQTASQTAATLQDLDKSATDVANALESTYASSVAEAAKILKDAGYAIDQVNGALSSAYDAAAGAIGDALSAAGFAASAIQGLGGTFASFGQAVEDCFDNFLGCIGL